MNHSNSEALVLSSEVPHEQFHQTVLSHLESLGLVNSAQGYPPKFKVIALSLDIKKIAELDCFVDEPESFTTHIKVTYGLASPATPFDNEIKDLFVPVVCFEDNEDYFNISVPLDEDLYLAHESSRGLEVLFQVPFTSIKAIGADVKNLLFKNEGFTTLSEGLYEKFQMAKFLSGSKIDASLPN